MSVTVVDWPDPEDDSTVYLVYRKFENKRVARLPRDEAMTMAESLATLYGVALIHRLFPS